MKLARNLSFALALLVMTVPMAYADVIGASNCPKYERRVYINSTFSSFQAIVNYAAAQGADGFKSTTVYNPATCSYIYTLKYLVYCVNYPWYAHHEVAYNDYVYEHLSASGGASDPVDIGGSDIALGLAVADDTYHVVAIHPDGSMESAPIDDVCRLFEGREDADTLSGAAADLLDSVELR